MKVLITGAAGRLGSAAAKQLLADGYQIKAVDQVTNAELTYKLEVINVLDREACYRVMEGCDAVIHNANHTNFWGGNAQRIYNENVCMNMNIFQAAAETGLKKIVFASSIQTIMGDRRYKEEGAQDPSGLSYLPADGEMPPNPRNPYALSKRVAEVMLDYFHKLYGMQCIAVRWPGLTRKEWFTHHPWGPMDGGKLTRRVLLDEMFAYLTYEDGARLCSAILRTDLPGFRIYMPAAPGPRMKLSMAEMLALYPNVPLRRPAAEIASLVDISRITTETGWTPQDERPQ